MKTDNPIKLHPTIGCCGIDCGLCPRFNASGPSACPGCGGENFREKHPSCGFVTCCVTKRGLETCAGCDEYPCKRFEPEKQGFDSFVTHQKVFANLDSIRDRGMEPFLRQQKIRMEFLKYLLANADDGRSKSYFCLACALLPVEKLIELQEWLHAQPSELEIKAKNRLVRERFNAMAEESNMMLKLRNPGSV